MVLAIAVGPPSAAGAQPNLSTTVSLGTPPALEVKATYTDPVDLFPRLNGTLVFPLWAKVRNISQQPQTLDVDTLQLTLGDTRGGLATLPSMNPDDARKRLTEDLRLNPILKKILTQGSGPWTPTAFDQQLRSGELKPGKEREGYVFFLKPAGFGFNGYMAVGTKARPPELLTTGLVKVAPVRTRSGDLSDSIYSLMEKLPGGTTVRDRVRGAPFGKSYALLFGISTYDDPKLNLPGAASDLQRMETFLGRQGFDQVVTVSDRAATESALRNVQGHFAAKIASEDRLLVYYAGHGQRTDTGGADLLLSRGSRVSMTDFMSWLRAVKVKHLLVLLDACYSGSAIGGTARDVLRDIDSPTFDKLLRLASQGSRYVITAGSATERAHEDPRWDGGLFTDAVLRALEPKAKKPGLVTTHEMFATLKDFMFDEERKYNLTAQTPLIQDLGYSPDGKVPPPGSEGEFVFVSGR